MFHPSTSDTICLSPGAFGRLRGLKNWQIRGRNFCCFVFWRGHFILLCSAILILILEYSYGYLMTFPYISHIWPSWSFPSPKKKTRAIKGLISQKESWSNQRSKLSSHPPLRCPHLTHRLLGCLKQHTTCHKAKRCYLRGLIQSTSWTYRF